MHSLLHCFHLPNIWIVCWWLGTGASICTFIALVHKSHSAAVQLNDTCAVWVQHDMFFILHTCKYVCTCKIDDVEPIVKSTCVCTRCVHNSWQMHTCMSGTYTPILVCMHFGLHANHTPRLLYEHVCIHARAWCPSWHKVQIPLRILL